MKKTIVVAVLAFAAALPAAAFVPFYRPAHTFHRSPAVHHRPPLAPKPIYRPHRPPPHLPPRRHPAIQPYWWAFPVYHHFQPTVGPVRQVEVWVPGHYETQLQPNGTSILVWVPGHYERRPAL